MVPRNQQYDEAKKRLEQAEQYYEKAKGEKDRKSAELGVDLAIKRYSKENVADCDSKESVQTSQQLHNGEKSDGKMQGRVFPWIKNHWDAIIYIGAAIGGLLIGMIFANIFKNL